MTRSPSFSKGEAGLLVRPRYVGDGESLTASTALSTALKPNGQADGIGESAAAQGEIADASFESCQCQAVSLLGGEMVGVVARLGDRGALAAVVLELKAVLNAPP